MIYVYCCNSAVCASKASDSWCAISISTHVAGDDESEVDAVEPYEEQLAPLPKEHLPPSTFPPCAVDIVEEPRKVTLASTNVEAEILRAAELNRNTAVDDEEVRELEQQLDLKDKPIDIYFDKFRRRLERMPTQVLRYQRDGFPLFMNPEKTLELVIPACQYCGQRRVMELQVLSTALYYLTPREYVSGGRLSGDDGVDFATATIYVCAKGCQADPTPSGARIQREFLFVEPAPTLQEEYSADGRPSLRQYFSANGP
jgi:hypothetical protein